MVIVLTGPAGAGKTTVGTALAARLDWPFVEGDRFHPRANVEKMARGVPLDDADRWPWLESLRAVIRQHLEADEPAVIACSALRASYREVLRRNGEDVVFVRLVVGRDVLRRRLSEREQHFARADLLASQLQTLEIGPDLLAVDAHRPVPEIVESIVDELRLNGGSGQGGSASDSHA